MTPPVARTRRTRSEGSDDAEGDDDAQYYIKYGCDADGEDCCLYNQEPTGVCGDGVVQPGEACDDGNTSDGDGCSAACEVECGFACEKKSEGLRIFSTCTRHCGDGVAIKCGGGTPSASPPFLPRWVTKGDGTAHSASTSRSSGPRMRIPMASVTGRWASPAGS